MTAASGGHRRMLTAGSLVVSLCAVLGCAVPSGDGRTGEEQGELTVSAGPGVAQVVVDARALADGTATREQRARLSAATSLSDAQRAALDRGGEAVISTGQMDYLSGLARTLDRDGGLAAFLGFGGRDAEVKAHLADGMQILSTPRVRTGSAEPGEQVSSGGTSGHDPVQHRRGGLDALPPSWAAALTDSPVVLTREAAAMPGFAGLTKSATRTTGLPTIDDLGVISEVLGHGPDEARRGSDIDRALIARAADIAAATNDPALRYSTPAARSGIEPTAIGETLDSMLAVAGRDEIAVHDAMMTGRDGGPEVIGGMPEGFSAPVDMPPLGHVEFTAGAYDANVSMTALLSFDWDEGAGHDSGMRSLLGWRGETDAATGDAGGPGRVATRAGETAGELARIIADNRRALVDVEPYGNDSAAQFNPGVWVAAAAVVGPHLISLAGGDTSAIGIDGARRLDGQHQMTDLFVVLDMHPDPATTINTHGADAVTHLQQKIGEEAEFLPNGDARATLESHQMGRITLGMQSGLGLAVTELGRDGKWDEALGYLREGVLAEGGTVMRPEVDNVPATRDRAGDDGGREEFEALENSVDFRVEATKRGDAMLVNLLNGYVKQRPELRFGELAPYFAADGMLTAPDAPDARDAFYEIADRAVGRLDEEVIKGVETAGANREW